MNRTKAKPFNSEYEEAFPFLTKLPLTEIRYEASFEWTQLLKYVVMTCWGVVREDFTLPNMYIIV